MGGGWSGPSDLFLDVVAASSWLFLAALGSLVHFVFGIFGPDTVLVVSTGNSEFPTRLTLPTSLGDSILVRVWPKSPRGFQFLKVICFFVNQSIFKLFFDD